MVTAAVAVVLAFMSADPAAPAGEEVRAALRKEAFPWYDAASDGYRPILPPAESTLNSNPDLGTAGTIGQAIVFVTFILGLAALVAALIWALRRYLPEGTPIELQSTRSLNASHIHEHAHVSDVDLSDPWGEAVRRRGLRDYAGATLALFVHQVRSLEIRGLIRLAPGRTGRQLIRTVRDGWIRARVEPTLRLFEAVYYGHRAPSAEDFEVVWTGAVELENRLAAEDFT